MRAIYAPKGKAGEYSELAVNLYVGCAHECAYCYCPSILRMGLHEWAINAHPKQGILDQLRRDAEKFAKNGDTREIMFCFMSDPYQTNEAAAQTREALLILEEHGLNTHVLTKAGSRAAYDFDIFKRADFRFGSTICFTSERMREQWEKGAPSIASRIEAVKQAHSMGIRTWVSMEPVIDPDEALGVIEVLRGHVDEWKIGKLNYNKRVEDRVDWGQFIVDVRKALVGETFYLKDELLKHER